jgi:2-methylcitrate dehydratase
MSTIVEYVSNYSANLHYSDLPADTVHLLKRMIIDSIGCAIGGYSSEPSKIARDLAGDVTSRRPCTIIGSGLTSSPDLATFANGVMIRYLDFNDGYTTLESGHPSDSIAATLAGAEMVGAGGRRLLTATAVAYEAFCRFGDAYSIRYIGFDHVTNGAIASSMGAARAMGLSVERTQETMNLGIAPNLALGQTRVGALSHWKGCAYANASRNAVFAAMLAEKGLTGPSPVFEGEYGFFAAVTKEPYELERFGGDQGQPFKVHECNIKQFALGLYSQTVVEAALAARNQVPEFRVDDVDGVHIRTLQKAIDIMAGDDEKWHPRTRETADHSMPYATAIALTYNDLNETHFSDQHINDPGIATLIGRTRIEVSEEANRRVPEAMLCNLDLTMRNGQTYSSEVAHFRGHHLNPMTDAEVEAKFRGLCDGLLTPDQTEELLGRLWRLEDEADISALLRLTRI